MKSFQNPLSYPNHHNFAVAVMHFQKDFNVANIIRTANTAAVKELIIVGRKRWVKSPSTGAQYFTKIHHFSTIDKFLEFVKFNNYNIVSVEINRDSENIFLCEYPSNTLLVIGGEGQGVPEKILENSKKILSIPQYGQIECLNAATAAGVAIYDWIRKNANLDPCVINGSNYKR